MTLVLVVIGYSAILIASVRRPSFLVAGFICAIVLNPAELFTTGRLNLGFNLYVVDLYLMVWLGIVCARFVLNRDGRVWGFPTWPFVSAFAVAGLIAVARGASDYGLVKALGEGRLVWFTILAFLVSQSVRDPQDVRTIAWTVISAAFLKCLFVYGQFIAATPTEILGTVHFSVGRDAVYFSLALLFLVSLSRGWKYGPLVVPWGVLFLFGGILLVQSRSAWLALAGALAAFVVAIPPRLVRAHRLGIAIGVTVLGAGLFGVASSLLGEAVTQRVGSTFAKLTEYQAGTGAWRLLSWMDALSTFREQPVLGEGFGNYFLREVQGEWIIVSPHNDYLALAAKTGLVGLLSFLGFLVSLGRNWWRLARRAVDWEAISLAQACFAGTVLLAVFIAFNAELHYANSGVVLWILAGVQGALHRHLSNAQSAGTVHV